MQVAGLLHLDRELLELLLGYRVLLRAERRRLTKLRLKPELLGGVRSRLYQPIVHTSPSAAPPVTNAVFLTYEMVFCGGTGGE